MPELARESKVGYFHNKIFLIQRFLQLALLLGLKKLAVLDKGDLLQLFFLRFKIRKVNQDVFNVQVSVDYFTAV